MALTPEEIRRMQMRAQAFKMGQAAIQTRPPQGPQNVYNLPGQQREQGYYYDQPTGAVSPVAQKQHWAKRLGMGALKGLDVMAAGGGGTLRRLGQAITPGEQILERELGRITQERGATMNPWEKFKRYGEASRLDPGEEWTTPFGWAKAGDFRYLPEKIGTRGIAEVAGDPINLAALVPFVGAPIRAAEMGLFGLAKGAIAGTAGSVGRGLAVGGGKRTLGEAAKGVLRAPGRGLARAGEEAVKGVKGSIDIERKIGRGIFTPTRATPKIGEPIKDVAERVPKHAEQEMMKARTGVSKVADDKANDMNIEGLAHNFTAPMQRFANTRVGGFVLGKNAPGFRETFGRSRLGVAFAERIGGLKSVARLEGTSPLAKAGRLLNRHNKEVDQGMQMQDLVHTAVRDLEREMGTEAFDFDEKGFLRNVFYDTADNQLAFDALTDNQKIRAFGLQIFEDAAENFNYKTRRIVQGGRNVGDDGGFRKNIRIDEQEIQIRLNEKQTRVVEGLVANLHDMGKHAYRKEIRARIAATKAGKGVVEPQFGGMPGGKGFILDEDGAMREIAEEMGIKDGKGYIARIWELADVEGEGSDWTSKFNLEFNRERIAKEALEQERVLDTSLLAEKLFRGEGEFATRRLIFSPADIISNYGKMAIRKNARDNMDTGLKKIWKDLAKDSYIKEGRITGKSKWEQEAFVNKTLAEYADLPTDRKGLPKDFKVSALTDQQENFLTDEFSRVVNKVKEGNVASSHLEATAIAFKQVSEPIGKRLSRHLEIRSKGGIGGFSKWVNNEIFGPLRGLRAGIDLGFMGINTLPLLFTRPQAYAQTWKRALTSAVSEKNYTAFVAKNIDKFDDMTQMGITLSGHSTDIYDALKGSSGSLGIMGKTPGIGKVAESLVSPVQTRLERSFYASLDSARLSLYDFYTPLWRDATGPDRLAMRNSMAEFINFSTGGYSSARQGITPTQRDIESGWIFFSPRYTRASLALVAKAFSGDVAGVETRRIMNNALTVAIPMYVHTANALGQEPNLDPTSGSFLSVKINGDIVGPATFFRQLATLTARLIEDPEAIAFMDDRPGITYKDRVFNHPIVKFLRGRTPLGTGLAVDIATGSDFMGNEIEGTVDWAKHTGTMALPFWAENIVFADPYRAGVPGVVSEMLGARSFPESPYNKRTDLRERLATEKFDIEWNLLTNNEKKSIELETPELEILDDEIREMRKGRDQGFDVLIEEKRAKSEELQRNWEETVIPLVKSYADGEERWTLRDITVTAKEASRVRRQERQKLNEDPKYVEIETYFDELHKEGRIVKQFADVLGDKYMNEVIESTVYADGTVNYAERDRADKLYFDQYPEMKEYIDTGNYLRGLMSDQPALLAEYYDGLREFRYYWESTEKAVLDEMPRYQAILPMYEEWKEAPDYQKNILQEENFMLNNFITSLKRTRKYVRRQDKILDRFLVRWEVGGVQSPQHPENKILHDDDVKKGKTRFRLHDYNIRTQDV